MGIETLKRLASFAAFCLIQVLVLNQIHLFGFITPLFYIYFVITFEYNYPRWAILLWSFAMGVVIDSFTNTPGVAAASLTIMGFIQPYVLSPFVTIDAPDGFVPTIRSLGPSRYFYYSLIMVFAYHILFFSIEMFSFFNIIYWLECIGGSALLTLLLILFVENMRRNR